MPKPNLKPQYHKLEFQLIKDLLDGLHEWRPDLSYPQSYSDMQACVRKLLKKYRMVELGDERSDADIEEDYEET